jgi:hypothetical protein
MKIPTSRMTEFLHLVLSTIPDPLLNPNAPMDRTATPISVGEHSLLNAFDERMPNGLRIPFAIL